MSFADKKGISVASGFKLQAQAPIDARFQVKTIQERDELVSIKAAYAGLTVYVTDTKTMYVYNGSGWDEVAKGAGYTHPTAPGYKHIPAGGASGQILKWKADGEAQWAAEYRPTVDSALNASSTNAIQNKVVKAELDKKLNAALKGAANGVASLDETGKVPATQLPSYVDDTIEGYLYEGKWYQDETHKTPVTGESGKIYVTKDTNKTYRWSGTMFVEISASLALGETASTAFAGDKGKKAYDHSQAAHAPANAEANVQSDWNESNTGSDAYIKNKPTSMPANGGNADTVGGHTVQSDVPANAKFTDTTYSKATQAADGLMSAADKKKLDTMPQIYFGNELPQTAPVGSVCFLIS